MALLLALALCAPAAQAAKTYKWVDENGVTHFSTRQPPRENSDTTRLQGGNLNQLPAGSEAASPGLQREDLNASTWEDCGSSLCRLVRRLDPQCRTSYCSRAKHFSADCTSLGCQTKRLAFEREVQDKLDAQAELRRQQAINANTVPTAPVTQGQD